MGDLFGCGFQRHCEEDDKEEDEEEEEQDEDTNLEKQQWEGRSCVTFGCAVRDCTALFDHVVSLLSGEAEDSRVHLEDMESLPTVGRMPGAYEPVVNTLLHQHHQN